MLKITSHQENTNEISHYTPTRMGKIKKTMIIPSVGENINQPQLLHIASGVVNWYILGNSSAVSYKVKYTCTL